MSDTALTALRVAGYMLWFHFALLLTLLVYLPLDDISIVAL